MKDYLLGLVISSAAIFAPTKELVVVSVILIIADLITGLIAAHKTGQKITSAGIRRTVSKLLTFNAGILLGFLVETYLIEHYLPLSKLAAGVVGVTELKSILENLDRINGNPVFRALIEKLGSINDVRKVSEIVEEKKDNQSSDSSSSDS